MIRRGAVLNTMKAKKPIVRGSYLFQWPYDIEYSFYKGKNQKKNREQ